MVQILPVLASAAASAPKLAKVRGAARLLGPVRHCAGEIGHTAVDQFVFWVIGLVIGGVRADNIDDGSIGPASVVQHGDAIGEPAAHMQEGEGWRARHASVSVRGAGDDVLLQTQHGTHLVRHPDFIDQLHLGRAGIGEACRNARIQQCFE